MRYLILWRAPVWLLGIEGEERAIFQSEDRERLVKIAQQMVLVDSEVAVTLHRQDGSVESTICLQDVQHASSVLAIQPNG